MCGGHWWPPYHQLLSLAVGGRGGQKRGRGDEVTSIFGKHSLQLLAQFTRPRQMLDELSSGFLRLMFVQCTDCLEPMAIVLWWFYNHHIIFTIISGAFLQY